MSRGYRKKVTVRLGWCHLGPRAVEKRNRLNRHLRKAFVGEATLARLKLCSVRFECVNLTRSADAFSQNGEGRSAAGSNVYRDHAGLHHFPKTGPELASIPHGFESVGRFHHPSPIRAEARNFPTDQVDLRVRHLA